MEDLTHQIQKEIKNIPSCKLQCIHSMKEWSPVANRDGHLCIFQYTIPCGSLKTTKITIGVELPINDYPRLPPHFIHLKTEKFNQETINKMGIIHQKYKIKEENWIALSRPPQDIWDGLPQSKKTLATFFTSHLYTFWRNL